MNNNTPLFPLYSRINNTTPAKAISLSEVVSLAVSPTVGPKADAAALTPYKASAKTKDVAQLSQYYALVLDHDNDNRTGEAIRAIYDPLDVAYLAWTTSSHMQRKKNEPAAPRWKVLIPFVQPVDAERYTALAIGAALLFDTDKGQTPIQQVLYAPNKLTKDAPYEVIDHTDRLKLDPLDNSAALVKACFREFADHQQQQAQSAQRSLPKPRPVNTQNGSIISLICAAYSLRELLEYNGYRRQGRAYLAPQSTTGTAGVYILDGEKERLYSHHGTTDPLSNLNHDGHALDAADVLCTLQYVGDETAMIKEEAAKLDPDGQKHRQMEHVKKKAEIQQVKANNETKDDQPLDLFNKFVPPPFPIGLLPKVIADYATDQSTLIGVDPAVIGMSAICAAASCIDDRIKIQPKRNDPTWTESARLWVAIIGDPSTKKSPGISKAMKPLFKIDQRWRTETAKALYEWQKDCDAVQKGDDLPDRPIEKRLIVNDITVEKLGDILSKSEPRGILSYQDELTGWLTSMDAYKNGAGKDRAAWLEAFNGGPKAIDRIGRGSTFVDNWSTCVLGGIQPQVVQNYAHNTNHDGMIQRFLLVFADPAKLDKDISPNLTTLDAYRDSLEQLAGLMPSSKPVTLSEPAQLIREALNEKLHNATVSLPNKFLTAAMGKWQGIYARLLLVFHCLEMAEEFTHPTNQPVSGKTAQQVADLMWRVLLPHAVRFYHDLDPAEENARNIASLLLARNWERFTVKRDLDRYMKATRKMKPWELEQTLGRLEAFSWIQPDPGKINEKGKPSAYLVNPKVHTLFTEHAKIERERRAEVSAMMAEIGR